MTDLVEFLMARLADDDEAARMGPGFDDDGWIRTTASIRAVVELHSSDDYGARYGPHSGPRCSECSGDDDLYIDQVAYPCLTVRLLAGGYAHHPDYLEEWKP